MAHTYRRRKCRFLLEYVMEEHSIDDAGCIQYGMIDRHSTKGRALLAKFHSDGGVQYRFCSSRFNCHHFKRMLNTLNNKMMHRWLKDPAFDPVFQANHLHSAAYGWWF